MSDTLPRVSEILDVLDPACYGTVPSTVLETAQARGTLLHQWACTHLAAMQGLCAYPEMLPEHELTLSSFLRWVDRYRVRPVFIEESSNTKLGYRGTPDALVECGDLGMLALPDFKFTEALVPRNYAQVAAYWHLDGYKAARLGMLVRFRKDGDTPDIKRVSKSGRDWAGFLGALSVYQWRQR